MSKLSARIFQHKRKRKIRRLTYPPCTMSHFAFLRQRCAYRLGKGRSMRCSKFKGERGDASRSKRHCYLSISKDPPPTKAEQKIKAQNRTYVYVRFWAFLMVFTLQSFALRPFALDTVKAVPPCQGGSIHQAILFAGRVIEKSIWRRTHSVFPHGLHQLSPPFYEQSNTYSSPTRLLKYSIFPLNTSS